MASYHCRSASYDTQSALGRDITGHSQGWRLWITGRSGQRVVGPRQHREPMNTGPFIGTEALAIGTATRRTLRSRHDAIYRNAYMPKGEELTPATRAVAAWLWSDRQATVAGLSAA